MRAVLVVLFGAAIVVAAASALALLGQRASPLVAASAATASVQIIALVGVCAVLEAELRQVRALLAEIRDRLPRA